VFIIVEFIGSLIFGTGVFVVIISIDWFIHIEMVRSQKISYGWSNYRKFKEEFDKCNWSLGWLNSLYDYNNQIHANIIRFNGVGMIINNPFSYYLTKRLTRKKIKALKPKYNTHKW
jgi:hypothetical protein